MKNLQYNKKRWAEENDSTHNKSKCCDRCHFSKTYCATCPCHQETKEECKHDYNNYVKRGRADLHCPKCDKDITLELVLMHEAENPQETKEVKNRLTDMDNEEAEKLIAEGVVQEIPNKNIEGWDLAEKLHEWYLEATKELDQDHYNSKAQKAYSELTQEQQYIDIYIADKIRNLLSAQRSNLVKEIEGLKNTNPQSIIGETYAEAIDDVINLINS
jgi:hypothetical protein